jgi:hypothetical protein
VTSRLETGKSLTFFLQCKRYIELIFEVNLFSLYCDVCGVVFSGYLLSMDVLGMLARLARLLAGGDLTDVAAQPAKPTQGEPTTGSEVRLDISKFSHVHGKDSILSAVPLYNLLFPHLFYYSPIWYTVPPSNLLFPHLICCSLI